MSTRGSICIKLRPEDVNKDFYMKDINGNDLPEIVHTVPGFPYMYVYCHHDSYIEKPGLGYNLPRKLQTYEDVRDYILQGDRTSLETPYTECGEHPEDLHPEFLASVDGEIPEDYFYLFDNDKWYVKTWAPNAEFKEIEYTPLTITLNEKEIEAIKYILDKYISIMNIFNDGYDREGTHLVLINRINGIKKKINSLEHAKA